MLKGIVPILRIFDEDKAREFYLEYLGFHLDWEHRFEQDMPLYMQVALDSIVIHLSEHHGDCTPGATLRIETEDLDELRDMLLQKKYKHARPGIEETPWNSREMTVTDPFSNRIIFVETSAE
ncbi:glyoxalase/bleomycin resistance/extradiol dioxygenase family protein [Paenibacillus sp. PCH8]|uniref:glyoxalase superfamily protein n=1 Tax=Paenibacillus sp. PCH8 TaxID=2066524 RepID=UPI000CF9E145|nr:glyoxalase superfamily protein [Paenibacillus sp. PCH8]PQP84446.1 glyoxalase/bleomycin resistance/extradiol dioxygenase family protein [Paenibacillus sp. PCH8]